MWPSRYWCSPSSGLAKSWRQSNTRHLAKFAASSAVDTSVEPFMEVDLRVFHRRLVRAGVIQPLLVERAPAAVQALADLVVLERGLDVGRLLRVDELALEQHDFLGVVELDDVGGAGRRARDEVRHHQHVRIPLEGQAGEVARPQ